MVFLSYPLFFAVLGLYVYDKFSGRRLKRQEWKAQLQGS
jgi:hypothetical protein